jgi:hypothetical protein
LIQCYSGRRAGCPVYEWQAIAAGRALAEMTVNEGGRDHHERIIAAKRYDRFGNVLRRDQSARADYHASPPRLAHAKARAPSRKPTYTPAPLGCCSFNATRQKETAQRPERRLPQCAVRRGLDLGREALGLVPDFLPGVIPKEKAPAGFGGASSLQGLKTRDYPACRNPYCRSELTSNQFSVGTVILRLPVAFSLQHARGNPSTVTASKLILGG